MMAQHWGIVAVGAVWVLFAVARWVKGRMHERRYRRDFTGIDREETTLDDLVSLRRDVLDALRTAACLVGTARLDRGISYHQLKKTFWAYSKKQVAEAVRGLERNDLVTVDDCLVVRLTEDARR